MVNRPRTPLQEAFYEAAIIQINSDRENGPCPAAAASRVAAGICSALLVPEISCSVFARPSVDRPVDRTGSSRIEGTMKIATVIGIFALVGTSAVGCSGKGGNPSGFGDPTDPGDNGGSGGSSGSTSSSGSSSGTTGPTG